jgi:hypothetical protein
MTRALAVVVALSLAGCVSIDYKRQVTDEFTPPAGRAPDQAKQEWAQCNLSTATTQGSATKSVYDSLFQLCMESKGWKLNPSYKP